MKIGFGLIAKGSTMHMEAATSSLDFISKFNTSTYPQDPILESILSPEIPLCPVLALLVPQEAGQNQSVQHTHAPAFIRPACPVNIIKTKLT